MGVTNVVLPKPYSKMLTTSMICSSTVGGTTLKTTPSPCKSGKSDFRARSSLLDRETLSKADNTLRGFFMLFWISIGYYILALCLEHWDRTGKPLNTNLYNLLSRDAGMLLVSDMVLVGSTIVCVPLHRLMIMYARTKQQAGAIRILQLGMEMAYLSAAISWIKVRQWPWVQAVFFILHAISNWMKMHSYLDVNHVYLLRTLAVDPQEKDSADSNARSSPMAYPTNVTIWNFIDYLLVPTLVYELSYPRTKRIRRTYILEKAIGLICGMSLLYINVEHAVMPLLYPTNDLIGNAEIRVVSMALRVVKLLLPLLFCVLLLFYIVFECICNVFAEITRFSDRFFYDDWWNSATYAEFSRKWNRPVHLFLKRHIYSPLRAEFGLGFRMASFLTFLFSALLHELVIGVCSGKTLWFFFGLQMLQIPLIVMANLLGINSNSREWLGNAGFWFATSLGVPLIILVYSTTH